MAFNTVFFGWNRPIPGREQMSATHFQELIEYLTGRQQGGEIQSFDAVLLNSHGGDMNGFFLIRGEPGKLGALVSSEEWEQHMTRAAMHLDRAGAVAGVTGDLLAKRMQTWQGLIPA